jgi:hypothetical protein
MSQTRRFYTVTQYVSAGLATPATGTADVRLENKVQMISQLS